MLNEIILGILVLVMIGCWAAARIKYLQLVAYLEMKKQRNPTEEEWEICTKAAWMMFWGKK